MKQRPTGWVGMEVATVSSHRLVTKYGLGTKALQATGVLLAAVTLSSCGQATDQTNEAPPTANERQSSQAAAGGGQSTDAAEGKSSSTEADSSATNTTPAEEGSKLSRSGVPAGGSTGVDRCHTSMLSGSLQRGEPGAGQRYAELVLTNDSGETCTLYGYGGLQLVDSNGQPLQTKLERTPTPGPTPITLDPGESASKTLHWTVVPHSGEPTDGPCQPEPAGAQVIPPDETDPLSVTWNFGPVCGYGSISGSAYHQ